MQFETPTLHVGSDAFLNHKVMEKVQKKWVKDHRGFYVRREAEQAEAPLKSTTPIKPDAQKLQKKKKAKVQPAGPPANLFGRDKSFKKPAKTKKNIDAATTIQRYVRGWWQRLQFRILHLQYQLDNRSELTAHALGRLQERTQKRKDMIRDKLTKAHMRSIDKETAVEQTRHEGQQVIAYLRKENKKLREKNQKIYAAICALRLNNERLEQANSKSDNSYGTLHDHAKTIKETHEKLKEVVPKYKESVDTLKDAVEQRRQFCVSEHKIKLQYKKCLGTLVDMVETSAKDKTLVDHVVGLCLEMESEDHQDLPPAIVPDDASASSEDSDNYDEYTVASMD